MKTMRAAVVEAVGGPEALRLTDIDVPEPSAGELLVERVASGVNFIEVYQRSGLYQVPLPFVPGSEGAGIVAAVGADVVGFRVGDRVTTAEARGTYADFFLVDADRAVIVPDDVSTEVAAAVPLQGLTAHYLSTSSAHPAPGETVLVHAGAGGVGLLLTQLLAHRGVHVIATASTPEKRARVLEAGAQQAIPYAGFSERVRELTDNTGVSVAYDGVGRDTFDGSLAALRTRGALVLFGAASGPVPPFELQRLASGGSLSVTRPSLGHFLRTPEERAERYAELFEGIAAGWLTFSIGQRFPLEQAAEAHRALMARETTGKALLVS